MKDTVIRELEKSARLQKRIAEELADVCVGPAALCPQARPAGNHTWHRRSYTAA